MNSRYLIAFGLLCSHPVIAQERRIIQTSTQFLSLPPDARSSGMGETGVSTNLDCHANFWNAGKLGFTEFQSAIAFNYTAIIQNEATTMRQAWLSGYKRVGIDNLIGYSIKHFKYGATTLKDEEGNEIAEGVTLNPVDYAISVTYSKKLGNNFAIGISPMYVYSGIANGLQAEGDTKGPGHAVALNVGLYGESFNQNPKYSYGITLNNIGTKLGYGKGQNKDFLPMKIRMGAASNIHLGNENSLTIAIELNKLLVPTPPIYDIDGKIVRGQGTNKSVPTAIFTSFTDSPGGLKEEIQEVEISMGCEYELLGQLITRAGIVYQNKHKGDRRHATLGLGFKIRKTTIDFSFLQPFEIRQQQIFRMGIGFDFN